MIVTDLDRTLLMTNMTISSYTKGVLHLCQEKGIKIVFATARYFRAVEEWIIPAISFRPDITISSNGAYAYNSDKIWYQALINPELANEMIREIHVRDGKITVGTSQIRLSEHQIKETHTTFSVPCDFQTPVNDYVHYIDFRGGNNIAEEITHLFPQVRLQSYVDLLTTFVHKNARKGLALQEIMRQLKITDEETAGFGDDVNDLDFMQICGTKVAVSNAIDEVKIVADHICESNDNDGAAKWLEEYVL
jgi:Cof subfamily protein (haloacid dehalogenase superfamily)